MNCYAVTVKKTRKPITKQHYLDYLDKLSDSGKLANVYFEDTKGLHCHFTMKLKGRLDYKTLYPTKYGWNAKAVPIYNRKGWIDYCRKDHQKMKETNKDVQELYDMDVVEDNEEYIDMTHYPTRLF